MPDYPSYNDPQAKLIARFPNPNEELDYQIQLQAENFSVLDPESGKPAYASLKFYYFPAAYCVDHPSLAAYLLCFRQERMTVEAAAARIVGDFAEAVNPHQMRLEAAFASRDGIEATLVVPWPAPDEDEEKEPWQDDED